MYKIGDFSQIAQVSVRMLRHYDKLGLLKPDRVDDLTGYRYYTLEQLPRLHRIFALRDLGISLEQIGRLLDDPLADTRLYELLQYKREVIETTLAEEQARLERVTARLHQIEQVYEPIPYDVALKTLGNQKIAAIREVVPHISQMGEYRDRILHQLYDTLAHEAIEPGVEMAIYHSQDYTEEDIDMTLGVEINSKITQPAFNDLIRVYNLPPAPLVASIVYNGNLWKIPDLVFHLYRWLGLNGYTSAGAYREIHLFGRELELCTSDPPKDGIIEILVPIENLRINSHLKI